MTHVSLFSGVGGIDLAAEWAGFETILQVEIDSYCRRVLEKHWPDVKRIEDIRDVTGNSIDRSIFLISGGDPCPIRSRARSIWGTKHPDLSGYFLAVVGRMRPEWVLRENVPASDVIDFEAGLDVLGYGAIIMETNACAYTGQNRQREFIIGCVEKTWISGFQKLYFRYRNEGIAQAIGKKTEGYPCLTTHAYRYDSRDGYIWDGQGALRIADSEERTKLAGFPLGWLDGLSRSAVARLTGNAVVPAQVLPILRAIARVEMEEI